MSSELTRLLDAAARWLGASEVRVHPVNSNGNGTSASDAVSASATTWWRDGADQTLASITVGADRVQFVALTPADGPSVLSVRRPMRRPSPAANGERVATLAQLVTRLLDEPAELATAVDTWPSGASRSEEPEARAALIAALRAAGGGAMFVVGIDRLGVVNEVFGHRSGDAVLAAADERIVDWAGPHATVARLSGTRFGVVRPDLLMRDDALAAARTLADRLAEPILVEELPLTRSASVGVATGGPDEAADLMVLAERGSLWARDSGGDTARAYDMDASTARLGRLRLELELHNALRTEQLALHYQPEFDLRTGQLLAVEALLRWEHPRLGLVRADAFVDDTERSRTFAEVQLWVVDRACEHLAAWHTRPGGRDLGLRINVSSWQLARPGTVERLLGIIDSHGIAPEAVCLELTERRMPRSKTYLAEPLRELSERGLSLAVDDFGTGEGSLSQLLSLPVDTVKIDQTFVFAMREDARADAVVAGIIALANSLELETVAEGVDGADTAARLVSLGCLRGQGNSLGEAGPAPAIDVLIER